METINLRRHSRGGGNPGFDLLLCRGYAWIPASAGMTWLRKDFALTDDKRILPATCSTLNVKQSG